MSCKKHMNQMEVREESFIKDSINVCNLFKKNKIYPQSIVTSYENTFWYGNILNNNNNYLVIYRDLYKEKTYYLYENNTFKEILRYSVAGGSRFLLDTIYDVNKDSYLDILTKHLVRSSTIDSYHLQNKNATLNSPIITYNSIQKGDKLLGYLKDNSPIVKFYKFQWNNFKLDTIEWVAYDYSLEPRKYVVSRKAAIFRPNKKVGYYIGLDKNEYEILDRLPSEYRELDSLYYH